MATSLWRKWRAARHGGPQLDTLLASADPDAPLAQRNLWMVDLCRWIDRPARDPAEDGRHPQHARLRPGAQVGEQVGDPDDAERREGKGG